MTSRRSFLGSILAAATPPGFVRAGVLMPVAPLIAEPEWIPVGVIWGEPAMNINVSWLQNRHDFERSMRYYMGLA